MRTVTIGITLCLVSCGGGSKGSGAGAPTNPTPPPQNRAPVITSVAVNPTFGIASLTVFNFTATANDPDGDAIEYRWDLAGNPLSGPAPAHTFPGSGGQGTARVTVTDGRGGTSTGSVNFIVGSMEGTWAGNLVGALFRTTLQQSGGNVSGSFEILTPSGFRITGQTARPCQRTPSTPAGAFAFATRRTCTSTTFASRERWIRPACASPGLQTGPVFADRR